MDKGPGNANPRHLFKMMYCYVTNIYATVNADVYII